MTTTPPPRTPCTCLPYPGGHHGIHLHADQVDDLVALLATIQHWLIPASLEVHLDLDHFLTSRRPARDLLTDQVNDLIHRLTTTPQDWLQHTNSDLHQLPSPPHATDPVDQLLEELASITGLLTRAGRDPRLAWTPC
jgi:hypothetical protein